jgi:hypothetical protein
MGLDDTAGAPGAIGRIIRDTADVNGEVNEHDWAVNEPSPFTLTSRSHVQAMVLRLP